MINRFFALLGYSPTADLNKALREVEGWRQCRASINEVARVSGIFVAEDNQYIDHGVPPLGVLVTGNRVTLRNNFLNGGRAIFIAPCASEILVDSNFFGAGKS
jgi:hypothetical protein